MGISVPIKMEQSPMSKPTNLDEVAQGLNTKEDYSETISVPIQIEQVPSSHNNESFSEKQFDPSIHERTQEIDIDAILALDPTPEETSQDLEDENREENEVHFIPNESKLSETAHFDHQLQKEQQRVMIQQKM